MKTCICTHIDEQHSFFTLKCDACKCKEFKLNKTVWTFKKNCTECGKEFDCPVKENKTRCPECEAKFMKEQAGDAEPTEY